MNEITKRFWETTYKQNIARMIGVCCRYTRDRQTAEDLAHDAFLVAITKSSSFENKGPFEAWLRRIVVNVALQYLREQKKQEHHENRIAAYTAAIETHNETLSNEEDSFSEADLLDAIRLLPEHHKLVFNLYVFENFTHAQIGSELGISEGTSKSHLARARKKIKAVLKSKVNTTKKKKSLFLLFSLPDRYWPVDYFLKKKLRSLEFQPQRKFQINSVDLGRILAIKHKAVPIFPINYLIASIATVAIIMATALYHLYVGEKRAFFNVEDYSLLSGKFPQLALQNDSAQKIVNFSSKPATVLDKSIIQGKETKNIERMKNANILSALLLASSPLATDSTKQLESYLLPAVYQEPTDTSVLTTKLIEKPEQTTAVDTAKLFGTFYASKLFWSAQNSGLYLMGKRIKVNLNSQKFTGNGTFTFINKINYLVVDGKPMKLNETVNLSDKKYSLLKLTEEEAIKKYGDKGKLIVEINLAE